MFVAKFSQTTSSKFKANTKKVMPYIGKVMKGVCTSSIIDGTMFQMEGLVAGQLYACENYTDVYKGKTQHRISVVCPVGIIEYNALDLGPAVLLYKSSEKASVVVDETTPDVEPTLELTPEQKQEVLDSEGDDDNAQF